MSAFDEALGWVILADYIGVDAVGKLNVLGAGFQMTAIQPTGGTPPLYVAGIIEVPQRYADTTAAMALELFDVTDGRAVVVPGPSGKVEALRGNQLVSFPRALSIAGALAPKDLASRHQMVMGFPAGLPLTPGHQYEWRLSMDGSRRKSWVARFQVIEPAPGPVMGGPAGPANIPNVESLSVEVDDDVADDQ